MLGRGVLGEGSQLADIGWTVVGHECAVALGPVQYAFRNKFCDGLPDRGSGGSVLSGKGPFSGNERAGLPFRGQGANPLLEYVVLRSGMGM